MDTDTIIVAKTLFGEARGCCLLDQLGVLYVIRERVLRPGWWGKTWASVCLHRFQFSCWNPNDVNRPRLDDAPSSPVWPRLVALADLAVSGRLSDGDNPWGISDELPTHYHDRSLSGPPPAWGEGCVEIQAAWPSPFRWYFVPAGTPPRAGRAA